MSDDAGTAAGVFEPAPIPSNVRKWREEPSQDWLKNASNLDDYGYGPNERLKHYKVFENYYDGEHRTKVLDRAKEYLEANGLRFCENFCDKVVDVMADRMKLNSFRMEPENEAVEETMRQLWEKNLGEEEQGTVHVHTFMKGDCFVVVSWDDVDKRATFEFNPPDCMKAVYYKGSPKIMEYAVKRWVECDSSPSNPSGMDIECMNIYYPDRVEKYFSPHKDGDWFPRVDNGDLMWPIPWTRNNKPSGVARGIPVVHFKNKPKGRQYGRSELRKAVPLQDAYNKLILDVFEICDTQGFPQRWATGLGRDQAKNLTTTPGALWANKNPEGKFGQFDAADLDKIGRMIERRLSITAGLTDTPVHMLMPYGEKPSGDAIRSSENGLVSKVRDRQPSMGNSWEEVMRKCLQVEKDQNKLAFKEEDRVIAQWKDPETRNLVDMLNAALSKQMLGVSKRTLLSELGYENPDEELERSEEEAARMMEQQDKIIKSGGIPQVPYGKAGASE